MLPCLRIPAMKTASISLQAKQSAANQLNRIRKAIYDLETFPLRYKLVEWEPWSSMNVHQFSVNNYEIFYIVDEERKNVSVIHVFTADEILKASSKTNRLNAEGAVAKYSPENRRKSLGAVAGNLQKQSPRLFLFGII